MLKWIVLAAIFISLSLATIAMINDDYSNWQDDDDNDIWR